MPPEGFKSVTIPEEIYQIAVDFYRDHEHELKRKMVRSVSELIQVALLYYAKHQECSGDSGHSSS